MKKILIRLIVTAISNLVDSEKNMYIVKNRDGNIISEYSSDEIQPGKTLFLRGFGSVIVIKRINDIIFFDYKEEHCKADIKETLHKTFFIEPYFYEYKYYDEDGYDQFGYDVEGYNTNGYNKYGYDKEGFNFDGYDINGYNKSGRDRANRDRDGYDLTGFNSSGYDRNGVFWSDKAKELPNGTEKRIFRYLCTNKGIILRCVNCGIKFFVSNKTLEFLKEKDYEIPKRCKKCRDMKNAHIDLKGKSYGAKESICRDNLIKPRTGREQHYRYYGHNT